MKRISAIIFDFDMTLADTLPFFGKILCNQLGISFNENFSRYRKLLGDILAPLEHSMRNKVIRSFYAYARLIGHNPFSAAWKTYRTGKKVSSKDNYKEVKPVIGIQTFLMNWSSKLKFGIVSNSSEWMVKLFLEKNNLTKYFDQVWGKECAAKTKDASFERMAASWNLPKEQVHIIGDLSGDVRSAQQQGMPAVGVLTGTSKKDSLLKYAPIAVLETAGHLNNVLREGSERIVFLIQTIKKKREN